MAQARVLARSLTRTHPGATLWTLVIDDPTGYIDRDDEPFRMLTPSDIGCDPFLAMAMRYSVLELSTAVKPWLLRHLMATTGEPVIYLDPDIEIFGSLESLWARAQLHGVVLTPHTITPIPQDDRRPSQVDVMIAGIYNLGFVALAPRAEIDRLLDWWAERLRRDCRVDPMWGYFVDQRWFDLAPGFISDLAIVRDPGYNVAYWNMHERTLTPSGDGYLVNGQPLAFFHFSGFDPAHPLILSRHQDRTDVEAEPAVRQILGDYAEALLADGFAQSRSWPYSYAALGDGTPLDETLRGLYDDFADESGEDVPSPFTLDGARSFEAWLRQQAPEAPPGVNRALARVWERRPDLRSAYTSGGAPDSAGLLRWAREYGTREEPSLAHVIANGEASPTPGDSGTTATASARARAALTSARRMSPFEPRDTSGPLHRDPFGINVVGYFRSELGTGEAARQIVSAFDTTSIPVLPIHGRAIPLSRQNHPYETAAPEDAPYPVNLICMNADMLPQFAQQTGTEFFAGRYSVGLWFWEVDRFPDRWLSSFSLLEEVWAPTAHIAGALEPLATVPVHTVRVPVSAALTDTRSRGDLGLDEDDFLFLFSFDYLSVAERKNPLAAIEAFRRAFTPGEGAQMIVKCINHDRDPDYHTRVRDAVAGHPDIRLIDRYLSPIDNRNLPALCDCYVSLHRAEGFGLVLADAMWHGKPVIATNYSGNLDFMTAANSLLVDYTLVPTGAGHDPYPADASWAQPDVAHAATLMRRVFDDREVARQIGRLAALDIRRTHSPEAAGEILAARLESIRATGRPRPRGWSEYTRSPALATLPRIIRQGPAPPLGRRRSREMIRTAALRAMRPFTVYQQEINRQIVDAMNELGDALGHARRDAAGELGRVLAELRGAGELRDLPELVREQARRIEDLERLLAEAQADRPER